VRGEVVDEFFIELKVDGFEGDGLPAVAFEGFEVALHAFEYGEGAVPDLFPLRFDVVFELRAEKRLFGSFGMAPEPPVSLL